MDTIFMNFEKSKTDPHRLLLNLSDKINLEKVVNMLLYQVLAYTKTFEISSSTWNDKFELTNGSYSVSDI